ncbi:MAG TPA: L-aspartate oxidase [Dehalococcoidia bacterium]|nr:L-aspartate oxidase [Dehalococcoidia bacterium]
MPAYDFIIVGSGIAGLYSALLAQERGRVLLVTKGSLDECNTRHAQGGIAAAIGVSDSPELHLQDTLAVGAGLCDEEAVRVLVEEAADRIQDLIRLGVPFDTLEGQIALAREGGHSHSRVLHSGGDATGAHIELTLSSLARASSRITIMENTLAASLVAEGGFFKGVQVLDCRANRYVSFEGSSLILATGGAGQLFQRNTNPAIATADGVALAFRAGAEVVDMEFVQFHPTALCLPGVTPFLMSEAMRGEGAILVNVRGHRFMADYHQSGELAPRDTVSRAILREMEATGAGYVLLDVSHLPARTVTTRFPTIYSFCLQHGLDITRSPIPVAPAAHYMMGGIRTDTYGQTTVGRVYACGEAACTGVHGANRLASNSLLEVLVIAKRIVEQTGQNSRPMPSPAAPLLPPDPPARPRKASFPALQALLWEKVGIIRTGEGLEQARRLLASWREALPDPEDRPSWELASGVLVGRLMAEAALMREESRGAHFRQDYPQESPLWRKRIAFSMAPGGELAYRFLGGS